MYGVFFVGLMQKKVRSKSRDKCLLLELAPATGMIILSLRTSHPFIHFHSLFYRTRDWLFSSIWSRDFFLKSQDMKSSFLIYMVLYSDSFFFKSPTNLFFSLPWWEHPLQNKRYESAGARRCFLHSRQP